MARKKEFHFDFNEDADPVEELHRLRAATAEHFKTMEALMEYHRSTPSVKEIIAELDEEIARKKAKEARSARTGTAKRSAGRRKTAKRPEHV